MQQFNNEDIPEQTLAGADECVSLLEALTQSLSLSPETAAEVICSPSWQQVREQECVWDSTLNRCCGDLWPLSTFVTAGYRPPHSSGLVYHLLLPRPSVQVSVCVCVHTADFLPLSVNQNNKLSFSPSGPQRWVLTIHTLPNTRRWGQFECLYISGHYSWWAYQILCISNTLK